MSDMKEYRLSIRVNAELRQRLAATAKNRGKRESDVVRDLMETGLDKPKKRESALDRARALGIVGILKDGPTDLSTNKKYFEGFGES
jgi:predicted DNA-binding protein